MDFHPINESARLRELLSLDILDTQREERFDRYTRLVAEIFKVPITHISLVDEDRQWFKSSVGVDVCETPLEESFCVHAIEHDLLVVPDALEDDFFRHHAAVLGTPYIRFYAGTVLRGPTGQPLGTLCIIDTQPRQLAEGERAWIQAFGKLVEEEINDNDNLSKLRRDVEDATLRDPVTGLPVQALLDETVAGLITIAAAEERHLAVIHLRVENLDDVDRIHGHECRNRMLEHLADRITSPDSRLLAAGRLGPSHFLLVAPLTTAHMVFDIVQPLVNTLGEPIDLDGHPVRADIHVGVSVFPEDGSDAHQLQERARIAQRDHASHGNIHLFTLEGEEQAIRRHHIEQRLETALLNERLNLHYQPLFTANGSRIVAFEGLARWHDDKLGSVSPGEFIPIIERNNRLSRGLTRWVLMEGCRQARRWQGNSPGQPVRVGVNIPAKEFYQDDFVAMVLEILEETGLEADLLTLELTEESLIADLEQAISTMDTLRMHGIRLALDDFGTGYSSLSYLKRLPVNALKLDKSFIDDLATNQRSLELAKGIFSLAHGLELNVVAEGVEHEAQRSLLEALGCDVIQGFLLGRPVDAPSAMNHVIQASSGTANRPLPARIG